MKRVFRNKNLIGCLVAMAFIAQASVSWGVSLIGSANIDFFNSDEFGLTGNGFTTSGVTFTSVDAIISKSQYTIGGVTTNNMANPAVNPAAPNSLVTNGVFGSTDAGVSIYAYDPSFTFVVNSPTVFAPASLGLPSAASDNVDWQATAENMVSGIMSATDQAAFGFYFTSQQGGSFTATMNLYENLLLGGFAPGDRANSTASYLFQLFSNGPAGLVAFSAPYEIIHSYDTAGILAVNGVDQLTPFNFSSPVLASGDYFFLAQATITNEVVPEPSTFILAGSGLLGLILYRRRMRC